MKNLFKALALFQSKVPVIHQNTKGYGYTYSSLAEIITTITPILKECNLGYTQLLEGDNLRTIIFETTAGESIESSVAIPSDVQLKGMNKFQVLGSAISYLRRYSLASALGLVTDKDTDGAATPPKEKATPKTAPKKQQKKEAKPKIETPPPAPKKVPAKDFPKVIAFAMQSKENRKKVFTSYDLSKKQREELDTIVFPLAAFKGPAKQFKDLLEEAKHSKQLRDKYLLKYDLIKDQIFNLESIDTFYNETEEAPF
jgi:hypothetical protein